MKLYFYDAESDVLALRFRSCTSEPAAKKTDWGWLSRDVESREVVKIEVWNARQLLPGPLLQAMPVWTLLDDSREICYFDREVKILWFRTGESNRDFGDEQPWGLFHRDRETDAITAVELWGAHRYLPGEILDCIPEPPTPKTY